MSRPQGLRVCCPKQPEWGVGHVLADDGCAKVTVFFSGGGKRMLDLAIVELDLVTGKAAVNPVLDVAATATWQHAHHNLYVIELKPRVFPLEHKFLEANLGYILGVKPCVFVGRRAWRRRGRRGST